MILALTALTPAAGDEQPPPEARLVDLNVVAVDSRGQPVRDLTSDDFAVTDSGKPQKIVFFNHNDSRLQQPQASRPNEFSNRNAATIPHVTLILFDLLNQRFDTRAWAANQIVHDLGRMESADDLYLYFLTVEGRFYPVHGFGPAEGEAAAPAGAPWTRQIKPLMDAGMRAVLRVRPPDIDVAVRVQLTYAALDAIAAQLSRFPGRKNIVWITDGVPMALGPIRSDTGDFVDFTPQLRQLSLALERAKIAIYPVRQVMLGSPDAIDGGTGVTSQATLDEFAGMTGGRANAGKDIGAAVAQAVNDVRSSYQIGYYPPPRNWDGKFHRIRVTCTRKGVRIQARTGYYAWSEPPEETAQRAVDSVLANPFDATEIGLRGTLAADPKDPRSLHFDIRINAADVVLAREGGQYSGKLRLALADYQTDGRMQNSRIVPIDVRYSTEQRDEALRDGIDFPGTINVGDQADKIRIVVFDRGSDAIGSLTMAVGTPNHDPR